MEPAAVEVAESGATGVPPLHAMVVTNAKQAELSRTV